MIVQSVSTDGQLTDMTTVKSDLSQALDVLEKNARSGYSDLIADSRICKISVVGVGMRHMPA